MKCPIDGSELRISDRQGIEIDYCPQCRGIWLDRGELDKLLDRNAQAQFASPPPREDARYNESPRPYRDDDRRLRDDDRRPYDDDRRPYDDDRRPYDDDRVDDRHRKKKRARSFLEEILDFD